MEPRVVMLSKIHSISAMVYYEIIFRFIGVKIRKGSDKMKRS
jgi:hypothetical protein